MTLENLVPSLDDCRRIPAEAFKDSALVWCDDLQGYFVLERPCTWAVTVCPAPTLAEILAELPFGTIVMLDSPKTWVCIARLGEQGTKIKKATNPAEAALLLWLELKGVQG